MKPLLLILGLAAFFVLIGWTWSELPRPMTPLEPTWTRSYQLYKQPHAIWLDQYSRPGANLETLKRVLQAAAKARQTPELVIYAIPMRDLGQSSEGGFANYEDYLVDNRLNAEMIQTFVKQTSINPVLYLEPDSLPLAVQYRRDHDGNDASQRIYADRIHTIKALITLYKDAGAKVYLEGGHSGWFDYGDADVQRIADALNDANIAAADGLATNVSNRQPITETRAGNPNEFHYLGRLLPLLKNRHLDVRVDSSRNGGETHARQYYLAPGGTLIDNESPKGRLVGHWEQVEGDDVRLLPFFGKPKLLSRLTGKEKFTFDASRQLLSAPPWLDAVGDVKLGAAPTDQPPDSVASRIHHYRYIKPPDDCDGALNCPPGASKHDLNLKTAQKQPQEPLPLPPRGWTVRSSPMWTE